MIGTILLGFTVIVAVIAIYFIPTIVAYNNRKKNKNAITLLNVFLGWTVIGWIGALIWSVMKD